MVYKNAIYNSLQNSFYCLQNDNRIHRRREMRFISSFLLVFGAPAFPGNACFPAGRRADLSFGLLFAPCRRVGVRSRAGNAEGPVAGWSLVGLPVAERAGPLTALQAAGTQPGAKRRALIRTAADRGTTMPRCQGGCHLRQVQV